MAVLFLGQPAHLLLLTWQEDDLVIDDTQHARDAINHRHQVNGHGDVVDLYIGVWTDDRRQNDVVNVHETVHLEFARSKSDVVVSDLEVAHRHMPVSKMLGKVLVSIMAHLVSGEETGGDATVAELVTDLADLDKEILPLAAVVAEKPLFPVLLRDGQKSGAVGVLTSLEIAEVTLREILTLSVVLSPVSFTGEDILLMDGITLSKGGHQRGQNIGVGTVLGGVGTVLLYGVAHGKDSGQLTGLGIEHAHSLYVLNGEVNLLEDLGALAARTEAINRHCHAQTDGHEEDYNV